MSVFIADNCAGGRAGEGAACVVLWGAGEGLDQAGGAKALYQARTGSRLLPTHRPWRLTTPPSPFFAPDCTWQEGMMMVVMVMMMMMVVMMVMVMVGSRNSFDSLQ